MGPHPPRSVPVGARPAMPDPARLARRSITTTENLTGCSRRVAADTVREVILNVIGGYLDRSEKAPAWILDLFDQAAAVYESEVGKLGTARTGQPSAATTSAQLGEEPHRH